MMLKRIISLLPSLKSAGWFMLGWTTLAHMSTADFSIRLFGSMSKWLGDNAWVGFLTGLGLLAVAVAWPELGPWIAKWIKIPQTLAQRLTAVEAANGQLGIRIGALETGRNETEGQLGTTGRQVTELDRRMRVAYTRLDEHHAWIKELTDLIKLSGASNDRQS